MSGLHNEARRADGVWSGWLARAAAVMACAVLALACTGCPLLLLGAGAGAGAGGAVYVMGKLEEELDYRVPIVHKAAVAGLKALDLTLSQNTGDKLTARMESAFADGKHIWVDLDSVSDSRTKVTIRVGLLGDEVRSRQILDAIKKHLPAKSS